MHGYYGVLCKRLLQIKVGSHSNSCPAFSINLMDIAKVMDFHQIHESLVFMNLRS